ncbi:MAG: hypothetical protein MJA31_19875, partial [Clostridia bacterium]|nr:hypothetical protein [Clostridia bacterium]
NTIYNTIPFFAKKRNNYNQNQSCIGNDIHYFKKPEYSGLQNKINKKNTKKYQVIHKTSFTFL